MAGNSFGKLFRVHTYGESHGPGIGVVIDGCPAGLEFDTSFIQGELHRRKPGQSAITTQRNESEAFIVQSGVHEGTTTGTPISLYIPNKDQRSEDYDHISDKFRPSHADMTYERKYGHRDHKGGGRASARETAARVAAGAVAKLLLKAHQIFIFGGVTQIGDISLKTPPEQISWERAEENPVRCPDTAVAAEMQRLVEKIRDAGDTVGGRVTCLIKGCPVGLGEPVFDKLHADLAKAMLSINAVKGFEYGSGFSAVQMRGSEHNDRWKVADGQEKTMTNFSGGIQGGISNGMPIYFNVAFKPVATIMASQESIDKGGHSVTIEGKGRHDPCVVPRAVPIVESMAALVMADHLLRSRVSRMDLL